MVKLNNDGFLILVFLTKNKEDMFPPGLEPGTFRVLGERDNHYTTETWWVQIYQII